MLYAQEYARGFVRRKRALREGRRLGEPKNEKPNVIFIMSDDLGYNDISYNSDHAFMPNIDFLANNGMIFDSFYTQPVCTPSRAQFMTGNFIVLYDMLFLRFLSSPRSMSAQFLRRKTGKRGANLRVKESNY